MNTVDGRIYKGGFENDMKNGDGIIIMPNGK